MPAMTKTAVLWFKRDLRLADHPAACAAMEEAARVIPLYIVEPALWAEPDMSARHHAFLAESLAELRQACASRGAALLVRTGDAVEVLEDLRARHGIAALYSHEETGNAWTYARDRRVAA